MGIEPDGVKPGVQPAPDVGGQTVPYHRRFLRMKVRDSGEAGVEKRLGGLVGAKLLRDKDAFEIRADSGGVQPGILYGGSAVGGEIQCVAGSQLLQKLLRAGDELMLLREQVLISVIDGSAAVGYAQLPEQLLIALYQDFFAGKAALFQQLPVGEVDKMVAVQYSLCWRNPNFGQCMRQGVCFPGGKIQDGVIQI